jgi:hypothetical protein
MLGEALSKYTQWESGVDVSKRGTARSWLGSGWVCHLGMQKSVVILLNLRSQDTFSVYMMLQALKSKHCRVYKPP